MIAIYPGSFDPTTNGHYDIIRRAANFVDELYVAVLVNDTKRYTFTIDERIEHLEILTKDIKNVKVESFTGLLVDFAVKKKASLIIRGLRAVTDFEYEFQMALTNRTLQPDIETLFISTSPEYLYLSSSIVKEIAKYNGDVSGMLPEPIKKMVLQKFIKN